MEHFISERHPIFRGGFGNIRTGSFPDFTRQYNVDRLVWFEVHQSSDAALQREKQLKEWKRDWKINLIERGNPHWIDLSASLSA